MDDLLIPMGINTAGELVDPLSAKKEESYFCPVCRSLLVLRQGTKNVFHFAHRADSECNKETVIHKTAKILIIQVVERWKNGGEIPYIHRSCDSCSALVVQPLPDKVEYAVEEYRIGTYIVDIVLMGKGAPLAALEIRVTHEVDELKQNELSIPFIELDGEEVIKHPSVWLPLSDKFNSLTCKTCKENLRKINEIGKRSNVSFAKDFYTPAIIKCYKCKQDILVFAWPKHGIFPKEKPVRKPFPRTVQFRYSKTLGRKYWANTCPYCNSIQGDYFLFNEMDGPFATYDDTLYDFNNGEVEVRAGLSPNQIIDLLFRPFSNG